MKSSFTLHLVLNITIVFVLIVVFFVVYNNFLLDKSLMVLEASLQNLKAGDALGIGLLINIDNVNEIIKDDFDEVRLAKLDYLGSTIFDRTDTDDTQIILSDLMGGGSQQKSNILHTLDNSVLALRRGIGKAFGSGADENLLRRRMEKAIKAHSSGNLNTAKDLYVSTIKAAATSRYADIAKALMVSLDKQLLTRQQRDRLILTINQMSDTTQMMDANFKLGQLEIQLLDFNQAATYFIKVFESSDDPALIVRSKFYLGWTSKQSGNLDESLKYFNELLQETKDEKLILNSKLQIANIYKRKKEFKKAAELYRGLAQEYKDSELAPTTLVLSKFTYMFDLNDMDKANEVTAELIKNYPAAGISEAARIKVKTEEDPFARLTGSPEGLGDSQLTTLWLRLPILSQAFRAAESAAARYAALMIEASIDRAIARGLDKNDILIIEIDPSFITNYVTARLKNVVSRLNLALIDFAITFPRNDHMKVSGSIKVGPKNFNFYIVGKIELKRHAEFDIIRGEYNPERWIVFTLSEGKFGPFKIPVNVANRMFKKAHKLFNQKQIFRIEDFSLSASKVYFSGPLLYTQDQLKIEKGTLDRYLTLYD